MPAPFYKPARRMVLGIPFVHGFKDVLALVNGNDRPFGQDVEFCVGYNGRNFQDDILFGVKPGHFQIHPDQVSRTFLFCHIVGKFSFLYRRVNLSKYFWTFCPPIFTLCQTSVLMRNKTLYCKKIICYIRHVNLLHTGIDYGRSSNHWYGLRFGPWKFPRHPLGQPFAGQVRRRQD